MEKQHNYMRWVAAAAVAIATFFGGYYVGSGENQVLNPEETYVLLLHEDERFSPGDPRKMFEEYSNWMANAQADGIGIDGQELAPQAVVVSQGNLTPRDENANNRVTGYFIVEAASMEEAVSIAQNNPHIKYGGSIEVKPFMVR